MQFTHQEVMLNPLDDKDSITGSTKNTKEARISNADNRDSLIVPDSIEYDGV